MQQAQINFPLNAAWRFVGSARASLRRCRRRRGRWSTNSTRRRARASTWPPKVRRVVDVSPGCMRFRCSCTSLGANVAGQPTCHAGVRGQLLGAAERASAGSAAPPRKVDVAFACRLTLFFGGSVCRFARPLRVGRGSLPKGVCGAHADRQRDAGQHLDDASCHQWHAWAYRVLARLLESVPGGFRATGH